MNTETIDRLFLELSQVTTATTANELAMRQQLDEKEEQRQNLMDAFARQGNSAQEVITELRQQLASQGEALAAALATIKLKDEALKEIAGSNAPHIIVAMKALVIQPDDSALKAWLGEPVAWLHENRPDADVITHAVKNVWNGVVVGRMAQYSIPLYAQKGLTKW